jgi:hypothetical protein
VNINLSVAISSYKDHRPRRIRTSSLRPHTLVAEGRIH